VSTYHQNFEPAGKNYASHTDDMSRFLEVLEHILPECKNIRKLPVARFKMEKLDPPQDDTSSAEKMKGLSVFKFYGGAKDYTQYTVYLVLKDGSSATSTDEVAVLACYGASYVDMTEAIGLPSVLLSPLRQFQIPVILSKLACSALKDTDAMAKLKLTDRLY